MINAASCLALPAAFTSSAAAQVDIDLGVGGDRYRDNRYDGDRYDGDRDYRSGRPGVRVYSGRSAPLVTTAMTAGPFGGSMAAES